VFSSGTRDNRAGIPYLNNTLDDCEVSQIRIKMNRADACAGPTCPWLSWSKSFATATTICHIAADDSTYNLNISTTYAAEPNDFGSFVELDPENQASMWWGAQLLSMWFEALRTQMGHVENPNGIYGWGDVILQFDHSKDIEDMDFISYIGHFSMGNGEFLWMTLPPDYYELLPLSSWNNSNATQPYIPQQLDGFAKTLYSTILVDLGQTNKSNILTDPEKLQYYLSAPFDVNRTTDAVANYTINAPWHLDPVLASESYNLLNTSNNMGLLEAKPAQIFSQYACQVPQRNSAGSLILSIIIGDLVLLQALWTVTKWTTDWWLTRTNPNALVCEGCSQKMIGGPYGQMPAAYSKSEAGSAHQSSEEIEPMRSGSRDGMCSLDEP
jgi:hypothetical protein